MAETYRFHEAFQCFGEKNIPYGMRVEKDTIYTHEHTRVEDGVFYITCTGNHFLCRTPHLRTFDAEIILNSHYHNGYTGFRFLFGYDSIRRTGYALNFRMEHNKLEMDFSAVQRRKNSIIEKAELDFPDPGENKLTLSVSTDGTTVSGSVGEIHFSYTLPGEYCAGEIGISMLNGMEIGMYGFTVTSNDPLEYRVIAPEKTVEIPLRGGGNMPYTLTYSVHQYDNQPYLSYSFDGGAQYREQYPDYPRETGQYCVEQDRITDPYVALYDSRTEESLCHAMIYHGMRATTDPGLVWQVLRSYFQVIDLPAKGTIPLQDGIDWDHLQISFGYGHKGARGYMMQSETDIEYIFDFATGEEIYQGKARSAEYIELTSYSEKTIARVPKTIYDYDAVIYHLQNNHFFEENESISFDAVIHCSKDPAFLTVKADLQDVYGEYIKNMDCVPTETGYSFSCGALPVGVYRIFVTVFYGDKPCLERDVVFEVYDPAGVRCAPLESGLPFLFSTPNEQKYLDRDAFDLYTPVPDCDMEHFYSCSAMPGDIGVRKKIWESNKLFARPWYVWNSPHRTITREEFKAFGEEILRHCDYCYYPEKHEWGVMRHDYFQLRSYNNTGLMEYLHDFLALHPEYDFGITPGSTTLNMSQLKALLTTCLSEWMDYANKRVGEDTRAQTEWMRSMNPGIKRACYGVFPVYSGPMTTHHSCKYIGHAPDCSLADYTYDGFGQLEDYPYSCSYHTYHGPYFVTHALLHNPGLAIYPEQYTASAGGCIDGAVKDAHPPLGKYDMPPYFNITLSYEYVYNTAHLTPEGFRFWTKRGFMQRDFSPAFVDTFVRGWKNVTRHEPVRPLRAAAYLSEIPGDEDIMKFTESDQSISNRSNMGLTYLFETARLGGLPCGFAVTYDTLLNLTPDMTDCVVLPSLKDAPAAVISHLRKLHESGVALAAVSRVDGLEDIFGVEYAPQTVEIDCLASDDTEEPICPDTANLFYIPTDAKTVLWAVGTDGKSYPAILRNGNALLLNAPTDELGRAKNRFWPIYNAPNISALLREVLTAQLQTLAQPTAQADNCGITLLEDQNGDTLLLAVNYSNYELASPERLFPAEVRIHLDSFAGAEPLHGEQPTLLLENGTLRGVCLQLHHQECALLRLIPKSK